MPTTGRYKAYRAADVALSQTGYLKAWISLLSDFDDLKEPVLSSPTPLIGEKYTIGTSHVWTTGKEALPIYVKKETIDAPGDTQGEAGSLRLLFTPKVFVIGDGAVILEMVNNWINEEMIIFVQDECSPAKYIQFGADCNTATVTKAGFTSGTLKSGAKGFEMTFETYSKSFYTGTISERA